VIVNNQSKHLDSADLHLSRLWNNAISCNVEMYTVYSFIVRWIVTSGDEAVCSHKQADCLINSSALPANP